MGKGTQQEQEKRMCTLFRIRRIVCLGVYEEKET